jgi:hypothetical protein
MEHPEVAIEKRMRHVIIHADLGAMKFLELTAPDQEMQSAGVGHEPDGGREEFDDAGPGTLPGRKTLFVCIEIAASRSVGPHDGNTEGRVRHELTGLEVETDPHPLTVGEDGPGLSVFKQFGLLDATDEARCFTRLNSKRDLFEGPEFLGRGLRAREKPRGDGEDGSRTRPLTP